MRNLHTNITEPHNPIWKRKCYDSAFFWYNSRAASALFTPQSFMLHNPIYVEAFCGNSYLEVDLSMTEASVYNTASNGRENEMSFLEDVQRIPVTYKKCVSGCISANPTWQNSSLSLSIYIYTEEKHQTDDYKNKEIVSPPVLQVQLPCRFPMKNELTPA